MSRKFWSVAIALSIVGAATTARAQSLKIGDAAPKLEVKSFVKGEPIKSFESGKNYVVEFWATWCGPCKTSIPHLTELQKKHPEVAFIGVSVFENDPSGVEPFVKEMGDKMDYRVAIDSVPEGKGRGDGAMAKNWMEAAGQNGIPTAFIVNKQGQIAWIGHPMAMEKPLDKVIDGTWDIKTAIEEKKKETELQGKMQQIATRLQSAERAGDAKTVLEAADELIALNPAIEMNLAIVRLPALLKLDMQDKALEAAKKLEKTPLGEQPQILNFIAWSIVDPKSGTKPKAELVKFALDLAKKADDKTKNKNGAIADTLATAYFLSGDAAKAAETEERALRLAEENGEPVDKGMKDRLEQFRKAADKK